MTLTLSAELQAEFDAWEQASDEDMARLNVEEELGWECCVDAIRGVEKPSLGEASCGR